MNNSNANLNYSITISNISNRNLMELVKLSSSGVTWKKHLPTQLTCLIYLKILSTWAFGPVKFIHWAICKFIETLLLISTVALTLNALQFYFLELSTAFHFRTPLTILIVYFRCKVATVLTILFNVLSSETQFPLLRSNLIFRKIRLSIFRYCSLQTAYVS